MTDSLAHTERTHRISESEETLCVNRKQHSGSRSVSRVPEGTVHLNQVPSSVYFPVYWLACLGVFLWSLKWTSSCGPCSSRLTSPLFSVHRRSFKRLRISAGEVWWGSSVRCIVLKPCWFWALAISGATELPLVHQLYSTVRRRYFPPSPSLPNKTMPFPRTSFRYKFISSLRSDNFISDSHTEMFFKVLWKYFYLYCTSRNHAFSCWLSDLFMYFTFYLHLDYINEGIAISPCF